MTECLRVYTHPCFILDSSWKQCYSVLLCNTSLDGVLTQSFQAALTVICGQIQKTFTMQSTDHKHQTTSVRHFNKKVLLYRVVNRFFNVTCWSFKQVYICRFKKKKRYSRKWMFDYKLAVMKCGLPMASSGGRLMVSVYRYSRNARYTK